MIRELADWNPERFDAVAGWPLAEALCAFWGRVRDRAERHWQFQVVTWQIGGKGKPPELPEVLRDE